MISNKHFSRGQQAIDALIFLRKEYPSEFQTVLEKFPSVQICLVNVYDSDLISRLIRAIEDTGRVIWSDGQPFKAVQTAVDELNKYQEV